MPSSRMKKHLAAILLLTASVANALGPEDQEFIGKIGDRLVVLQFNKDPNVYTGGTSELAACEYEGDRVVCRNAGEKGSKLIYLQGDRSSTQFLAARALYKRFYPNQKIGQWNNEGVYRDEFFVCSLGCSSSVPKLFILVTHGD